MGERIEINVLNAVKNYLLSRLSWASGLKYAVHVESLAMKYVSPFMGERIEIGLYTKIVFV